MEDETLGFDAKAVQERIREENAWFLPLAHYDVPKEQAFVFSEFPPPPQENVVSVTPYYSVAESLHCFVDHPASIQSGRVVEEAIRAFAALTTTKLWCLARNTHKPWVRAWWEVRAEPNYDGNYLRIILRIRVALAGIGENTRVTHVLDFRGKEIA